MLQYITNTRCPHSVVDQVKGVIEGGCRWVQIRMKDADDDAVRRVVEEIRPKVDETQTFLILDDRVELAKELNVGGVHVGKNDMSPSNARVKLGPGAVVGATANTIQDIMPLKNLDVDYIGVGPFRFTETKENLAPVLGLEGLKAITAEMERLEIFIPIVAIGGIRLEDVKPILATGVNGIAVSGAIAFANDIKSETEKFIRELPMKE